MTNMFDDFDLDIQKVSIEAYGTSSSTCGICNILVSWFAWSCSTCTEGPTCSVGSNTVAGCGDSIANCAIAPSQGGPCR